MKIHLIVDVEPKQGRDDATVDSLTFEVERFLQFLRTEHRFPWFVKAVHSADVTTVKADV